MPPSTLPSPSTARPSKGSFAARPLPKVPRAPINVAALSGPARFEEALRRAIWLVPAQMRAQVEAFLTPMTIVALAAALAAWVVSHYFAVGFILDLMLVLGIGMACVPLAWELMQAGWILKNATCESDLDEAAVHLANAIATVGVEGFSAVVFGAAGRAASAASAGARNMASKAGMTFSHYNAFASAATKMNRIIAVRMTNPASLPWIRQGFPAKPLGVHWHTSKATGIVTAVSPADIAAAKKMGYYVVDSKGVPRNAAGSPLQLPAKPGWPVEAGQIIDPDVLKPVVGDYDLLDVIDPSAWDELMIVWSEGGTPLLNKTNPEIEQIKDMINGAIGVRARVMHGPWAAVDDVADAGDSLFFYPDGSVVPFTAAEVKALYFAIGRKVFQVHR
jgi:hypothetical protein